MRNLAMLIAIIIYSPVIAYKYARAHLGAVCSFIYLAMFAIILYKFL